MSNEVQNEILTESGDQMLNDFAAILAPWKDFGSLLKGELKKTVINLNAFLTLTLGPTLASADYAEFMKQTKAKTDKIDADAKKNIRTPSHRWRRQLAVIDSCTRPNAI